ncbi:hypothetical protein CJF31_00009296 [Rutstroemia sp. NJR-2017a BVV2]|nr:hypothetical protein CJF31_00009296 [Rutstroemia sp. NJR-2017a BVV2]
MSTPTKEAVRKIKSHRKSRRGCGNCKLRKVKCDEKKPHCKRCTTYGVLCNYEDGSPELQLQPFVVKALNFETLSQRLPYSLSQTIVDISLPNQRSWLNGDSHNLGEQRHLRLLDNFQSKTVYTITTERNLQVYQNEFVKLSCLYPHLMHSLLTFTLMHDRFMADPRNSKISSTEIYHWYQGIALFSSTLSSSPPESSAQDALYATSILLGMIAFANIEADTPKEAWPLNPASSMDLNWLTISWGKQEVWKLGMDRNASAFKELLGPPMPVSFSSVTEARLQSLPRAFKSLYGLDATSTVDNNPYHLALSILADTMKVNDTATVILLFWSFVCTIRPVYKRLLFEKEPKAILLLSWWLAKVCEFPHWWIWRRVSLECQAICIYLEQFHRDETDIVCHLEYPKAMSTQIPW